MESRMLMLHGQGLTEQGIMVDRHVEDARTRFWDRYIQALRKQGVKPPFDRWHVRRAEQFINAHPDQRLLELGPEAVQQYLRQLGHKGNLKAWQYQQVVRAIQTLYSTVNTAWAKQFDWQYWMDAAQTLEPEHVSTARDAPAPTPSSACRARGGHSLGANRSCTPSAFRGLLQHGCCEWLSNYHRKGLLGVDVPVYRVFGVETARKCERSRRAGVS